MKENGIVIAFNPTNDFYIRKQTLNLAEEFDINYRIYENAISLSLLDECAKRAYLEGYEALYIITDEKLLVETENFIKKLKLFEVVLSVPRYYSDRKARFKESNEKLKLKEQGPEAVKPSAVQKMPGAVPTQATANAPAKKLLVLGVMNANPMIKGHGDAIKEILTKDVSSSVARYLPKFLPSWDTNNTIRKIYLMPADSATHAPIPASIRAGLLSTGLSTIPGLYGENGASSKKFGLTPELFISGVTGTTIYQSLQESVKEATNLLVFTPKDQVQEVIRLFSNAAQNKYNLEDGKVISVIPLTTTVVDAPDDGLVSKGIRIAQDSVWKQEKAPAKPEEKTKETAVSKKIELTDIFTCGLITVLHGASIGKIDPADKTGASLDYLAKLWAAFPVGDRELLADIANNMGPGKIFSAVADIVKFGKAVAGVVDKAMGSEADKKKAMQDMARMQKIFQELGYDLLKMVNNSEYESFKAALDF